MTLPRLTTPSYLVLGLVRQLGEASAYDVKVEAGRTVAPFWSMPHAQVYQQCERLVEAGLLAEVRMETPRNRRVLRVTEAGAAALREWLADLEFVPVEARERAVLKLWFGASGAELAPAQVEAHGTALATYEDLATMYGDRFSVGQRQALEFGRRYEQMLVDFWKWVGEEAQE